MGKDKRTSGDQMILGYASIGLTIIILLVLARIRTVKPWPYYIGAYVVGSTPLLSTTLASTQLVGADIHVEYHYAYQALINGWDTSLNSPINACLPIVLGAPAISRIFHIDLIWVFKVIYPLLYAFVPVLLLYIYSRFMPIKWAFLSAIVFIIIPTFFLEIPAISRQMIAELFLVGAIALLVSKVRYEYKVLGLLACSILVVVSHYSTAYFWFLILGVAILGYLLFDKKKWRALDIAFILGISVGIFIGYSRWVSSGWIMVDSTNMVKGVIASIQPGQAQVAQVAPVFGTPSSINVNWIPIIATLILIPGIYRMLKAKEVFGLYKTWVVMAFCLLVLAIMLPSIANMINFTRYYHLMLIFLAPAVVYTFWKYTIGLTLAAIVLVFIVSSGLAFHLIGFENIEKPNIPYSIALENERLDAGSYLTRDDRIVSEWASKQGFKEVYGDLGGTLALQEYLDIYHTLYLADGYLPDAPIFIRSWNTDQGTLAYWVGPGLRKQVAMPQIDRPVLFHSGNSILYGAKE